MGAASPEPSEPQPTGAADRSAETARPQRARPHSLTAQVVAFVEELCVGPDAKPGRQLPSEKELAERFGVSRVVLREAMKTLETKGLVHRRQGKPAVIASPNALPVESFVALSVLRDRRALMEFTEIRKALEVHGARLAAQRIAGPDEEGTRPHIERARRSIAEMRADPLDMPTRVRTDFDFHQALAEASGNRSLAQILGALEQSLAASREESHRRFLTTAEDPAVSATEHEVVLDAVLTGEPARAVEAMEHHLQVTLHEIRTRPDPENPDSPGA
ncbi:FadR/GntR family transcriptional regulator [Streptomonospora litoralis]|uniref:HTH-type transcriptional regulator LutR n=1 Tax=Streptomonospora litoralis TaxID=2498135 RepID=A0A4P6Q9Z1_9ACTN|nr:FadR/GntR family transcriptional regulator [Streptomonospora litoralis]QBI56501.1 HTH-type transcriptional regulator LutR [Streptomonospora litoralis]